MANASDNKPHWKAYILGPFTGVPKLIGGLKRDDSTAAFHGAQATVWGLVFLLGLGVLSVGLHFALPYLGNVMGMTGIAVVYPCLVVLLFVDRRRPLGLYRMPGHGEERRLAGVQTLDAVRAVAGGHRRLVDEKMKRKA